MGESYFTYDKASGRFYPNEEEYHPFTIGERPTLTSSTQPTLRDYSEPQTKDDDVDVSFDNDFF